MSVGRPAVKKLMVINEIRDQIVSGDLAPGARVPTRRELSASYDATLNTVQQALESLERDGFVVSRVGQGTFVTEKPPHLNEFALVFPTEPDDSSWRLYWDHLASAARLVVKDQGLHLSIYTGINASEPGEDYQQLLADVQHDRLAGIIFPVSPFLVAGTDILDRPGIPRISVGIGEESPSMGYINFNMQSFNRKAVAHLRKQGVKTAAVLGQPVNYDERLLKALAKAGISCPYYLQHAVPLTSLQWAKHITRLICDASFQGRPDALIIQDDNLFDPALSGILDAGLRIPQDLEIVTHSNFPWQTSCPVEVTRLGFDMIELLKQALAELESQRAGNSPKTISLEAVFEEALPNYAIRNSTVWK